MIRQCARGVMQIARHDQGLGLAEVVVGMMVLTLITLCTMPVLAQGSEQSSDNATLTAAAQFADEQVDRSQASEAKCSSISALAGSSSMVDSRGVRLTRTTIASSPTAATPCPTAVTAYPTTVVLSVQVVRNDTGASVAAASTQVYVDAP